MIDLRPCLKTSNKIKLTYTCTILCIKNCTPGPDFEALPCDLCGEELVTETLACNFQRSVLLLMRAGIPAVSRPHRVSSFHSLFQTVPRALLNSWAQKIMPQSPESPELQARLRSDLSTSAAFHEQPLTCCAYSMLERTTRSLTLVCETQLPAASLLV